MRAELVKKYWHNPYIKHPPQFFAPFLAVNFAAIPENLIESEIFGYEGGAFTGARLAGKPGYFEIAQGGTIFIDEIGDMSFPLQTRLLRILQEKEVIRIGSSHIINTDVRIIAATNVDLKKKVAEGKFRQDLYFRLNVLSLSPPPLRKFKNSINSIIKKYLKKKYDLEAVLEEAAANTLQKYNWPGNVRELLNGVDYMLYSSEEKVFFKLKNIPPYILHEVNCCPLAARALNYRTYNFRSNKNDIYIAVLNILAETRNHFIGRSFIKKELEKNGIDITEHYMKIIMLEMKKAGLIEAATTRQGSYITEKGYCFLEETFN